MSEDPRNAQLKTLAAENKELRAKLDATEVALASAREELAARDAALKSAQSVANARDTSLRSEEVFVLKTKLSLNGETFARGEPMPFDPKRPPEGCDGLVEGVHYERARILTRAPQATA